MQRMAETAAQGQRGGVDGDLTAAARHGGGPKSPKTAQGDASQGKPPARAANDAGKSKDDAQSGSGTNQHRTYKIARFCNTMKVYKKFCSLTKVDEYQPNDAEYADGAENSDHTMFKGIDKSKKTMGFRQYSGRDDMSHGTSADALSFIDPRSTFRDDGRA